MGFSFIKCKVIVKTVKKSSGKKIFLKKRKLKKKKYWNLVNLKINERKMSVCYLKISLNTAVFDRAHSCSSITQRQP